MEMKIADEGYKQDIMKEILSSFTKVGNKFCNEFKELEEKAKNMNIDVGDISEAEKFVTEFGAWFRVSLNKMYSLHNDYFSTSKSVSVSINYDQ